MPVHPGIGRPSSEPVGSTLDAHDAYIKSEIARWIKLARAANIDAQ